jgi:hypothetical protein
MMRGRNWLSKDGRGAETEEGKKRMTKTTGTKQRGCDPVEEEDDVVLSQFNPPKEGCDEIMEEHGRDDLVDYAVSLKKERMQMEKIEAQFEERSSKLASHMMIPRDGVDLMDVDKLMDGGEENMAHGKVENSKEEENELDQLKIVHYKKVVHKLLRSSVRVEDKSLKIIDKAIAKKGLELKKTMMDNVGFGGGAGRAGQTY